MYIVWIQQSIIKATIVKRIKRVIVLIMIQENEILYKTSHDKNANTIWFKEKWKGLNVNAKQQPVICAKEML